MPVLEIPSCPADKVECCSDYMTLPIPRSHAEGLRRWLGKILHLPGTLRAPGHLDPLPARCGHFLHPAPNSSFIFRTCSMQKGGKENYRLEIRILHKGVKRLQWGKGFIMKCPAARSKLGRQSIYCGPTFIRVSRPLPLRSDNRQSPWPLSLRGELVASLGDASLMGLYVDISAIMVTIQSPRQDLLQRQKALNHSVELRPLWLVSSHSAYSLEAACPPVSSQPGSEVLVHIPRQRLGLVKRSSHFEGALSLKSLQVHQAGTFIMKESRGLVVVSIPGASLLQAQPCQEPRGAPGMQAFYSVDLSLEFAESATPVLWTVENYFRCAVSSGTESPASTPPSWPLPGPETPPAGSLSSSRSQDTDPVTLVQMQLEPWPVLQTARPADASWVSAAPFPSRASQDQCCSQAPLGETGLPCPSSASATLSSGPLGAVQAGPRPSQSILPASTTLATHLFSEASASPSPSRRPDLSEMSLGFELPVILTKSPQQDTVHGPGSPLPGGVDVAITGLMQQLVP
ncbi:uncharacterized protein C1orf127 homolog [Octodon degus]|uniref:Uncharacterized protein C1orf127 homolog n=1 Tax=Octodon degus TaxID=10160 RepID=A0A6P6D6B1_OCTDE|nr:uncharacterized protein C1orf127 homolog [Octodon degus]